MSVMYKKENVCFLNKDNNRMVTKFIHRPPRLFAFAAIVLASSLYGT